MKSHTVSEYESGWYVERADDTDVERAIEVAGPFATEREATKKAEELDEQEAT